MKHSSRYLAFATGIATILSAGPAFAVSGYSTAHLNLRSGPGTQYPIAGVMEWNVRSQITGCLVDWSWCSVNVAGLSGWASAEYLVVDQDAQVVPVTGGLVRGIPIVAAEGVAVVVAAPAVGVVVGPAGRAVAIVPEQAVVEYIKATPVNPHAVQGEIVVGAVMPAGVQLVAVPNSPYGYAATPVNPHAVQGEIVVGAVMPAGVQLVAVPNSPYGYAVVNGVKVLVDPVARTVVYIHR